MTKSAQLTRRILDDFRSGRFPGEAQLPPEPILADTYGVSRGTVREALSTLARDGQIRREKGRGTFWASGAARRTKILFALYSVTQATSGTDVYYSQLYQGACQRLGPDVDLEPFLKDDKGKLVDRVLASCAQGVIFPYSYHSEIARLEELRASGIRVVAVNAPSPLPGIDHVFHDHLTAGIVATKHLVDVGCRRIAFVGLPEHRVSAYERYKGFRSVLIQQGLDPRDCPRIVIPEYGEAHGYQAGRRILERSPRPDGVVAVSDDTLVGVMRALLQAGLRVPQDIKAIGYGDYSICEYYHPTLSTIHTSPVDVGRQAAELLLDVIHHGDQHQPRHIELPVQLVARESTLGAGT